MTLNYQVNVRVIQGGGGHCKSEDSATPKCKSEDSASPKCKKGLGLVDDDNCFAADDDDDDNDDNCFDAEDGADDTEELEEQRLNAPSPEPPFPGATPLLPPGAHPVVPILSHAIRSQELVGFAYVLLVRWASCSKGKLMTWAPLLAAVATTVMDLLTKILSRRSKSPQGLC
jgi:hypothetical protein